MNRAIGILLLAALAAVRPAGASTEGPALPLEQLVALRSFQRAGHSELPLVDERSSRHEVLLALADAGSRAAAQPAASGEAPVQQDYAALVAMLQQYRDELAALGLKQASLDAALLKLKERADALERRAAEGTPDGLRIHGRYSALYDDLLATGPGALNGNPARFQHAKQHAELVFAGQHGPFAATVQLDVVNMLGSYFPQYGARRAFAELRAPLSLKLGTIDQRLTPFTLWRNEDEDPFEPEPFRSKRQRLRDDYFLKDDHAYYLPGLRASAALPLFAGLVLEIEGIGGILGDPESSIYSPADPSTGLTKTAIVTPYTTYLAAWRLETAPVGGVRFGYFGARIWDAANTAKQVYGPGELSSAYSYMLGRPVESYDNQVHSGRLLGELFDGDVEVGAEAAISRYMNPNIAYASVSQTYTAGTPAYFQDPGFRAGGAAIGTATSISAAVKLGPLSFRAYLRQVDEAFVAPAAQARTMDRNRSPYGPFVTDNVLFNPADYGYAPPPYLATAAPYAESQLNYRIIPPSTVSGSGSARSFNFNYLLPSDPAFNAIDPYGDATPNRRVFGTDLRLDMLGGGLKPWARYQVGEQQVGLGGRLPEKYFVAWGGVLLDLRSWWKIPLRFSGDYRLEDTRNGEWVGFDSVRADLGVEYEWRQGSTLNIGLRHLDYNGTIYSADPAFAPAGKFGVSQNYEVVGFGLAHRINEMLRMDVVYTNQVFPDRDLSLTKGVSVAYQLEQTFARFTAEF